MQEFQKCSTNPHLEKFFSNPVSEQVPTEESKSAFFLIEHSYVRILNKKGVHFYYNNFLIN